jgi:hypothetical protein
MMIAAAFFGGTAVGISAMILLAFYLAARPKTETTPQHNGISAVSVSLGGNQTTEAVQIDKEMLTKILRAHGADKLIELPTTTRH